MPRPLVVLVAAVARDGGIGIAGGLLTRIPEDLQRFKSLTLGAPIVMGRKTWQSIGRPLPGRRSIVVSRRLAWHPAGAEVAGSFDAALALAAGAERVFVIGGAEVYTHALPFADALELTEIDAAFDADTFFPPWDRRAFRETARLSRSTTDGLDYDFASYARIDGRAA